MTQSYKHILINLEPPIAIVTLNRPEVLNALSQDLMAELVSILQDLDSNDRVRAVVLTGGAKVFAAGADIKEMSEETTTSIMLKDRFATWESIRHFRKPLIAAVSGYALGGGCELALNCDIIVASESAQFGQPEINIGVMPGAGGTQRLTRLVGKYKAMEMILTGTRISAQEAKVIGLANKIVPVELLLDEAKSLAHEIAKKSPVAVRLAKQSVLKSFELPLSEALEYERKNFYMLFSSEDQKEGMKAFLEKRTPVFSGR